MYGIEDELTHIVASAQSGDSVALADLLTRFEGLLRSVARRYQATSGYDEAYQEACLAFLLAVFTYERSRGPFTGYAAAKVRGDVRTAMRRIWRIAERWAYVSTNHDEDDAHALDHAWLTARIHATDVWAEWLQADALRQMVRYASLSDRETLWLQAYLAGYTPETLARGLNVSNETVKTWRKRALAKLRKTATKLHYRFEDLMSSQRE